MQNVDSKALIGFLKRILCSPNGAGVQVGNLDGPQEFARLLRNVKLLSARFNGDFKSAWKLAGAKHDSADDPAGTKDASIDFEVLPRLAAKIKDANLRAHDGTLNTRARDGGSVSVYARHSLGSGKGWLRVGYGFWIKVEKTSSHEKARLPTVYLYAWASSHEFAGDAAIYAEAKLSSFELISTKAEDSVDKVETLASKRLIEVLQELEANSTTTSKKQKMAINLLLKAIGAKLKPAKAG